MWALGVICLLAAWYSVLAQAPIWKFDALWLVWNALILAVLSIPIKLDCHNCTTCNVNHPGRSSMA